MNIRKGQKIKDGILNGLIWLFAFITIGILAWIIIYIISKGLPHINWEFLSTKFGRRTHGIFPIILTTLYVIAITIAISTPIGIFSAIYLVEYAKPGKLLRVIRFATESLAGIPSIIYGLFGYVFFVITLGLKFSLLSGSLTLSIMVLPTIIRTTEEALKSVPPSYKEGSLALGATKLRTISKVVLPCAIPGILTAVILSIGRIVGETAALMFTAGTNPNNSPGVTEPGRTLSVHLYQLSKEGLSLEQAFATATVLVVIVALINFLSGRIARNITKHTMGS